MNAAVDTRPHVAIVGSRGIPNRVGGFETFAEILAQDLVDKGWRVTVICEGTGRFRKRSDSWRGIDLLEIPPVLPEPAGALVYDCRAMLDTVRRADVVLLLGYNTGFLCALTRIARVPCVVNMDGIEYRREKWSKPIKAWFWANERLAARLGNHLIADNPAIYDHLARSSTVRKLSMIAYGSDLIETASEQIVRDHGLLPQSYVSLIARLEPENSTLEIVRAYSAAERAHPLVVVGPLDPDTNDYHAELVAAGSPDVRFLGAIYDREAVQALRFHSLAYVHGHRVGGTNPSLVEALATGSAIVAHDNVFNRWVLGDVAEYFGDSADCVDILERLLNDSAHSESMRRATRARHLAQFTWGTHLEAYDRLLRAAVDGTMIPLNTDVDCGTVGSAV